MVWLLCLLCLQGSSPLPVGALATSHIWGGIVQEVDLCKVG